ncbi:PREDICTED: probable lysophospholipase BODYGUARD 2 [Camelina sativa]|uniref:Probable lysophospholipase BODYGUARD 2 n=1 Tax=Camelina sativa TaxID=90675 RepID=A0ABM0Y788_CAMSA|nr:PREDICTED: probable lysophospholipase BODYGUARD 2 [Camelina sativa]
MPSTRLKLHSMGFSRWLNRTVGFIVFFVLDIVDFLLCFTYKTLDFFFESEWKPCYCCPPPEAKPTAAGGSRGGKMIVSERSGDYSKVVSLTRTKIHLDEISDTLYSRPSLLTKLTKLVKCFKKDAVKCYDESKKRIPSTKKTILTVNSTVVEKLQRTPRWSDCHCTFCTSWLSSSNHSLFVNVQQPKDNKAQENVVFIHGFLSSSTFWTETLFPNFSDSAKSSYRLLAVDLLGYGKSPKPNDSLYTLKEHLEMIERSVISQFRLKTFHVVAHSLGCILALALAVKHPGAIKSLTLLAPPYYSVPKGVQGTQYVMRRVAPKEVWPPMAFGASVASWYEHISRTVSLVLCKNHHLLEFLTRLLTGNRMRTYLIEGFLCHTHNASWHTLHNIIFGSGSKVEAYLDHIRDNVDCDVTVFHGGRDELIPVECSYGVKRKVPRARIHVVPDKDHITIVVGRQKEFARELELIWRRSTTPQLHTIN